MVAICVDAGTSLVKAVAFSEQGEEIAVARQAVAVNRLRPGWSEQSMEAVWHAVVATVREVAQRISADVRFLAITAQGDGCWLVDAVGEPVGPAILWNDGRASAIIEQWQKEGILEQAFRVNGTCLFPGAQCAILRWLYENDFQRLARADKVFYCKDWIVLNMTGERVTDESDASIPFFDIRSRRYAPELLELYGIDWAQRLLPPVHANNTPVGGLRTAVAKELGLPAGLPVVAAPFDIAATALGLGATQAGQAVSILGTTLCNEVVVDSVNTDVPPTGLHICCGLPERWIRGFPTMCGTEAIDWICQLLSLSLPSELSALASEAEPGANGVVFLPYLSPAGERAPFLNPYARGSLAGLSLEQNRAHIARAVFEGLSFAIRECLQATGSMVTELHVCGGGAVSDLWCQLLADITCLPVYTSTVAELGARGALFVGMAATGLENNVEEAAQRYVKTGKLYEPYAPCAKQYEALYHHFLAVRDIAAQTWNQKK